MVKLGKKGQVSIPRSVLADLGLEGDELLLVERTEDGAILLRPAAAYPLEIYSDDRMAEFRAGDEMTPQLSEWVAGRVSRAREE